MPEAAVIAGGRPCVSSGSTSATSATMLPPATPFFIFSSGNENTATAETSEPLPAVVGIIIVGRPRAGTFSEPTIAAASSSGNFASTAAIFAKSIELPPPSATRQSPPSVRISAAALYKSATGGSGSTSGQSSGFMPSFFAPSMRRASASLFAMLRPVMKTGRFAPSAAAFCAARFEIPASNMTSRGILKLKGRPMIFSIFVTFVISVPYEGRTSRA